MFGPPPFFGTTDIPVCPEMNYPDCRGGRSDFHLSFLNFHLSLKAPRRE